MADHVGIEAKLRDELVYDEMELAHRHGAPLRACAFIPAEVILYIVGELSIASARQMAVKVI